MSLWQGAKLKDLPVPEKAEAVFLGWYFDRGFTRSVSEEDAIYTDLTLFARWRYSGNILQDSDTEDPGRYFVLSFESNGGSVVKDFYRREGSSLGRLPIPYKQDSIFGGWHYD